MYGSRLVLTHTLRYLGPVSFIVLCFGVVSDGFVNKLPRPAGVNDYDVTSVQILRPVQRMNGGQFRSFTETAYITFNAFGTYRHLKLRKIHPKTPYQTYGVPVTSIGDDATVTSMYNLQEKEVDFYQGEFFAGVFAVHNNGSKQIVHGVIHEKTEDIVVEPFTSHHHDVTTTASHHVVYKRNRPRNSATDTYFKRSAGFRFDVFNIGANISHSTQSPAFATARYTSFLPGSLDGTGSFQYYQASQANHNVNTYVNAEVEALVWTDLSFFLSFQKRFGHTNVELEILKYITVVVHSTINCSKFTLDHARNGSVDNHIALNQFASTLRDSYKLHSLTFRYDFAVAFTRYDLTDVHGTPIGVSFTDEICSTQSGKSSAILEDQGGFSCIGTFVHELAHVLGSDHDGWFRSRLCPASVGYIMSSVSSLTKNAFYFSQCSVNSIKEHLRKRTSSCVYNHGRMNALYTALGEEKLPGQIYNKTEQCQQIYGTNFCLSIGTSLDDICYKMYCWDPILPNVCSTKSSAAPGTSCGPHKWCLNGECVHSESAL